MVKGQNDLSDIDGDEYIQLCLVNDWTELIISLIHIQISIKVTNCRLKD